MWKIYLNNETIMKTIKKLFWLIILVLILYIILIFVKPVIADNLWQIFWIKSFNKQIRTIKKWIDIFSKKLPDAEEISQTLSWAKEKISNIKEWINNIRTKAKDIEEKYEQTKEFIEDTSEKIDKLKDNIDDLQKIWKNITNLVNTWSIK